MAMIVKTLPITVGTVKTTKDHRDCFVKEMISNEQFEVKPLRNKKDWYVCDAGFNYHESWISLIKQIKSVKCVLKKGIKATDNVTGQKFFFYTEIQSDVENAMTLMGYGCRDYNLSLFKNRKQPLDTKTYRDRD